MSALTLADINTAVNHEPRIMDLRLAEALGFDDKRGVRRLAERHMEALERFGEVSVTVTETSAKGGRPGRTYWLNLRQALYLATKSEAENAVDLTVEMVDLFASVREGRQVGSNAQRVSLSDLRPGHALMRVGSRTFLVDTRRYRVEAGELAVRMHFDGKITVGRVDYRDDHQNWFGSRKGYTPWHKPGPNDPKGTDRVRTLIQVVGAVVEEVTSDRPKLPTRSGRGRAVVKVHTLPADVRRQVEVRMAH